MADLGTATVTLVAGSRVVGPRNQRRCQVKIVTGDGVKTYPAGGVPLPAKLGVFAQALRVVDIYDSNNDGIMYQWDSVANTIRMYFPTNTAGGNRAAIEFTSASTVPALNVTLFAEAVGA